MSLEETEKWLMNNVAPCIRSQRGRIKDLISSKLEKWSADQLEVSHVGKDPIPLLQFFSPPLTPWDTFPFLSLILAGICVH